MMDELDWFNEGSITFEECTANLKKLMDTALNVMFHIGYERGAEDLKETIYKSEV